MINTISRKERVRQAVAHQATDIVPYHVRFQNYADVAAFFQNADFDEQFGNHFTLFRPDFATLMPDGQYWEFQAPIDGQHTYIDETNVASYPFPDPEDPRCFAQAEAHLARFHERFVFVDISRTLFERAYDLRGYQQILEDLALNPELVHTLFTRLTEFAVRMIEQSVGHGFDGVRFGDDWGTQHGLLMSPRHWQEFIRPYMQQMFEAAQRAGYVTLLHSCGNIEAVIPDLIELGLDILEPIQPEVIDVYKVKREYGRQIAFWGGVSLQQVLAHGTVDDVEREVRDKMRLLGQDGGYICGPSHTITRDVPMENTLRLLDILRNQPG